MPFVWMLPGLGLAEQWIPLFNGKDLKGWKPKFAGHEPRKDPDQVFRVEFGIHAIDMASLMIRGKKSFYGDRFMQENIRGICNKGVSNNWNTFHELVMKGDFSQSTVAPSCQSHCLVLLAREACYRGGEPVTWDEVIKSTKAMSFDTTGLKA